MEATISKSKKVAVRKQKVALVPSSESNSVESFISQAIASGASVETLERLFALMANVKAEKAKEAFVRAMGQFQQACPVIKKSKKVLNKDGHTVRYMYAPLESIVEQIKKPVADAGLSYSWDVKHPEGHMDVTCKITHVLGHFETSTFEIPIGSSEYMTAPQAYASAQTFAKRYTLCNALGISTGDEDTDATTVGKEKPAKSDKSKIIFLLRTLGQRVETKEQYGSAVKNLTQMELVEGNYSEIVTRLEVLVSDQNENTEIRK